jgi:hypothetical protein
MFPRDRITFGDIAPGKNTAYQEVPHGVYRYAAFKFVLNGEEILQPVIDWVGETPMSGRKFTYGLTLDPSGSSWNIVRLVEVTRVCFKMGADRQHINTYKPENLVPAHFDIDLCDTMYPRVVP